MLYFSYYINHYTRLTTWEDPRLRYRQIHGTPTNVPSMPGEHIPLQVKLIIHLLFMINIDASSHNF